MAKAPAQIRSLARSHTETMINVLVGIANKEQASDSARVAAAVAVLDRGWGKPDQLVDQQVTFDASKVFVDLLRQVNELRAKLPKPVVIDAE